MTQLTPAISNNLEIILENEDKCIVELHSHAIQDSIIIGLWLRSKRSPRTVEAYSHDIYRFYEYIKKSIREVGEQDLYDFRDSLTNLKPTSKHRTLAAIKSLFSKAKRSGYIPVNAAEAFELPKLENKLAERIMSEQAVQDILTLEKEPRNHAILTLLYYGGLRCEEICTLTWRNLQERDQTGQIAVFGKGKKTRFILLDIETWHEVWGLRESAPLDEYVFLSRQRGSRKGKTDRRMSETRIWQIVEQAAIRAGVALYEAENKDGKTVIKSRVSPHWFRHAHATHSLEAGASLPEVQQVLGHERPETTMKYTHIRPTVSTATILRKKRANQ